MLICIKGKDFEEAFSPAERAAEVHFRHSVYVPGTHLQIPSELRCDHLEVPDQWPRYIRCIFCSLPTPVLPLAKSQQTSSSISFIMSYFSLTKSYYI